MNWSLARFSGLTLLVAASATARTGFVPNDIPSNLVVDVRVFEARSVSPDFTMMESLGFFVDTDGTGVSDRQWLATIARKIPDSYLATLAWQTVPVEGQAAHLTLEKRSRSLELSVDLSEYLERGTFAAVVRGELERSEEPQREFERSIELRTGQTFVFSGAGFELSASDYLSHFRDYSDRENRREVYDRLRDFAMFLVVAITPRLSGDRAAPGMVELNLPDDVALPDFESPFDVELVGTVELELVIGDNGTADVVNIVRSSIPEVNPRVLGEASHWRFPNPAGTVGRLVLKITATPE